jgi:hypothetical protein
MKQQLHGARRQDRLSFVWILDEQGVLIVFGAVSDRGARHEDFLVSTHGRRALLC